MTRRSDRHPPVRSIVLVTLQFVVLGAWAVTGPRLACSALGLGVQLAGLGLGTWAVWTMRPGRFNIAPDLRRGATLCLDGPYRLLRHPMYASLLYLTLPPAICPGPLWRLVLVGALVVILGAKMAIEEPALEREFPDYRERTRGVKRWIPWVV